MLTSILERSREECTFPTAQTPSPDRGFGHDAPGIPRPHADATLQIEIWKVKKLIKRLEAARGNGTSMISLIIRTSKTLTVATQQQHSQKYRLAWTDSAALEGPS